MNKKIIKFILVLIVIIIMSVGLWVNSTYAPDATALNFIVDTENVDILEEDFGLSFIPFEQKNATGIIFYPGAKVEPEAYSPLAYQLAEKGYLTTIVEMPFNLAVFDVERGTEVINYYDEIQKWYIGGHSLGGAMAGSFAYDNQSLIEGLFFLGAYPVENFSNTSLDILLINGSLDAIINRDRLEEAKNLIPKDSRNITIEGANHSQFGSYGFQKNDKKAEISYDEQLEQTVELIIELLEK